MKKRIFISITAFALILVASIILKTTVFNSQADENKDIALNETTTEVSIEIATEEETFNLPEIDLTEDVYYGNKSENTDKSDINKDVDDINNDLDTATRPITVDELDELDESSEEFKVLEPVATEAVTEAKSTAKKDNKTTMKKDTTKKSDASKNTAKKDTTSKNTSTAKTTEPTTKAKVIDESSKTKKDNVKEKEYTGENNSGKIDWDALSKSGTPVKAEDEKNANIKLTGEKEGTWEKPD